MQSVTPHHTPTQSLHCLVSVAISSHIHTVILIPPGHSGRPSTPQISVSTDGQVRLQISSAYAGVTAGDNSFHFNVSVYNNTRGFLYLMSLNVPESGFLGTSVSLSHELSLQPGSYRFSATAGNRYGCSLESELTPAVSVGEGQ